MLTKVFIDKVEFYITNVCNFNCDNCNRLNNFYFSGHQYWKDYKDIYQAWSLKFDIANITVLGGEPLLNPSLAEWLEGLRILWPNSNITLLTNGTRLEHWPTMHDLLYKNKILMTVSLHNRDRYDTYVEYLEKYFFKDSKLSYEYANKDLVGWVDAYNTVKAVNWPDCLDIRDFQYLPDFIKKECEVVHKIDPINYMRNTGAVTIHDANNVKVILSYYEHFWSAPLKFEDRKFEVYNSDPNRAHEVCQSKYCHHFIKGKLYKCHHVALLPEFMNQFAVNISAADKELLLSYRPLEVDQSIEEMKDFVSNLRNKIDQCKLCPENLHTIPIKATTQKIKLIKNKSTNYY